MAATKETQVVAAATVSDDIPSDYLKTIDRFLEYMGVSQTIKPQHNVDDSFSNLVGGVLKVISIERGKVSCFLNVKAPILNAYGGMHGGAVGSVAERVAIACARTVVGENTDLFLGELSISYLSAAPHNAEVIIDGHVVRSGRNLTVVAVNFRVKESGRLAFLSRATFYYMPVSSLCMIVVCQTPRAQFRYVAFGLYIMFMKKWMSYSFIDWGIGICYSR